MGRIRVCQVSTVDFLAATGASGLIIKQKTIVFYGEKHNVWVTNMYMCCICKCSIHIQALRGQ